MKLYQSCPSNKSYTVKSTSSSSSIILYLPYIFFAYVFHKALQVKVDYCVQNCSSPLFHLSIYIYSIFHVTVLFIYLALTFVHNILCGTAYIIVSFSDPVFLCFVFQLTFLGLMGSITYPVVL